MASKRKKKKYYVVKVCLVIDGNKGKWNKSGAWNCAHHYLEGVQLISSGQLIDFHIMDKVITSTEI